MIAGCGLNCIESPVYIATKTTNAKLRDETAEKWSSYFDNRLNPDELYCDGCKTKSGKLFGWCEKCPVRICVMRKGLRNCSLCSEYPCMDLIKIHEINPQAKIELDKLLKKNLFSRKI